MKTDIQIAQEAKMEHIKDVAARAGIEENELEFYGKYKAKLSDELWEKIKDREDGKLVLVTAINPTYCTSRTIFRTLFRNQRRSGRRRLFAGCADGRSESSFYGRFSCNHVGK